MNKYIIITEAGYTQDLNNQEVCNHQVLSILDASSEQEAINQCVKDWTECIDDEDITSDYKYKYFINKFGSIEDLTVFKIS